MISRFRRGGRGMHKKGTMNGTERAFSLLLESRKNSGEIAWFRYEGLKFRLAEGAFYTPDFAVMKADGEIEIYEVKGYWEEAALVRIKVASEMYPFKFISVKKIKSDWEFKEI